MALARPPACSARAYGRRVAVVAGKGNNGADGRVAAGLLRRRGARVTRGRRRGGRRRACPLRPGDRRRLRHRLPGQLRRARPCRPGAPVLAVDIPSGVDGDTGVAAGRPMAADRTVTFAALKPGLLQADGARLAGEVVVADIGVPVGGPGPAWSRTPTWPRWCRPRARESHKWASAVAVVAGSPGMEGAAVLAARRGLPRRRRHGPPGRARGGRRCRPRPRPWPIEAVRLALPARGGPTRRSAVLDRCRALVVGPGLGRGPRRPRPRSAAWWPLPGAGGGRRRRPVRPGGSTAGVVRAGRRPVVLTPHDGEYARLAGERPGPDRVAAARRLAAATGAVVLFKGALTAVGRPPDGRVLLAVGRHPRLATAGTGDVLSGMIGRPAGPGGAPARGRRPGRPRPRPGRGLGPAEGLVADDLPELVSTWLSAVAVAGGRRRRVAEGVPARPGPRSTSTPSPTTPPCCRLVRPGRACARWSRPTATATGRWRWPVRPWPAGPPAGRGPGRRGGELREAGIDAPILLLSEPPPGAADGLVAAG